MNKQNHLDLAELIDSFRVFPRIFLALCFWFTVDVTWYLLAWYTRLPLVERSTEASGFGAATLLGLMAFLKLVFSDYSANGRDWSAPKIQTTTSSQSTQTIQP